MKYPKQTWMCLLLLWLLAPSTTAALDVDRLTVCADDGKVGDLYNGGCPPGPTSFDPTEAFDRPRSVLIDLDLSGGPSGTDFFLWHYLHGASDPPSPLYHLSPDLCRVRVNIAYDAGFLAFVNEEVLAPQDFAGPSERGTVSFDDVPYQGPETDCGSGPCDRLYTFLWDDFAEDSRSLTTDGQQGRSNSTNMPAEWRVSLAVPDPAGFQAGGYATELVATFVEAYEWASPGVCLPTYVDSLSQQRISLRVPEPSINWGLACGIVVLGALAARRKAA